MEMWVSGTGIALDYRTVTGRALTTQEIVSQFEAGDREATAAMKRFEDRLARGLAQVINILDPDVIVFGGGVSKVQHIYQALPALLKAYVFGGEVSTPVLPAKYGDSSGVRGAAWLWPNRRG
jgi:fructokinase